MVEIVKKMVSFVSEDPSGQSRSCANSGSAPHKSTRSRDVMNFEVIETAAIVG